MSLQRKYFKKFEKFWYNIPQLDHLEFKDKIKTFLDGQIPELDDTERQVLENFYSQDFLIKLANLRDEAIDEIDWNLINIKDEHQLNRYRNYLMAPIDASVWASKKLSYINSIESFEQDLESIIKNVPWDKRKDFNLLKQTLRNASACYLICEKLKEKVEKIPEKIDQRYNAQTTKSTLDNNSVLEKNNTLRDLFPNVETYEWVILQLVENHVIFKYEDVLIWIGLRKGAKYEIATLQEVLYMRRLIKKKADDIQLGKLAENTFQDFTVNPRTLRGNRISNAVNRYLEIFNELG